MRKFIVFFLKIIFFNEIINIFQRYRKHSRMNSNLNRSTSPNELLQNFPNLRKTKGLANNGPTGKFLSKKNLTIK